MQRCTDPHLALCPPSRRRGSRTKEPAEECQERQYSEYVGIRSIAYYTRTRIRKFIDERERVHGWRLAVGENGAVILATCDVVITIVVLSTAAAIRGAAWVVVITTSAATHLTVRGRRRCWGYRRVVRVVVTVAIDDTGRCRRNGRSWTGRWIVLATALRACWSGGGSRRN